MAVAPEQKRDLVPLARDEGPQIPPAVSPWKLPVVWRRRSRPRPGSGWKKGLPPGWPELALRHGETGFCGFPRQGSVIAKEELAVLDSELLDTRFPRKTSTSDSGWTEMTFKQV